MAEEKLMFKRLAVELEAVEAHGRGVVVMGD